MIDIFDLKDKHIVVTGASSGIGRETAVLLSKLGAVVTIVARRKEELDILKTSDIYRQVSEKLGGEYTWWSIRSGISITKRSEDSLFVDIRYTATSEKEAITVVNTFAEMAPAYVASFVPRAKIIVISPAERATRSALETKKMVLIGGVVGVILAYAVVFLIDFNDKVIKSEEDFASNYDLPILGTVPNFDDSDLSNYKYLGGY